MNTEVNIDGDEGKISIVMVDNKWVFVRCFLEVRILITTKHTSAVAKPFSNSSLS